MAERTCSIGDCDSPAGVPGSARGWCRPHYMRWQKYGDPYAGGPSKVRKAPAVPRTAPFEERFWSKVDKTETCWLWVGALDGNGYGLIYRDRQSRRAHRVAWELDGRELIDGLELDHLCRVRNCVRPTHLEQVPGRINILRGVGTGARNAVKTHCPQGHEYTDDNTYLWTSRSGRPWRICRTCRG